MLGFGDVDQKLPLLAYPADNKGRNMNSSLLTGSLLLLLLCSSCAQSHNLAQHPLDGKRIAIVSDTPAAPFADFNMTQKVLG